MDDASLYETVIGLEIHLQLNTVSKMFCRCQSGVGNESPANSAICPLCSGQPGALPVINEEAVKLAVRAGIALNARVNKISIFARKNYFYPDLPKGYQISQDDKPIIENGFIEINAENGAKPKKINIIRAHLEEDAGKSTHGAANASLIDFNRSGVPLLEIVSAPDINSPAQAYNYLTEFKSLMKWLDISDCDMEKGELRVDVNVSIKPVGSAKLGVRAEIKNLNSFKAVKDSLTYEISRQKEILSAGGALTQQTMLWDEKTGKTSVMRDTETAQEYRYFPEPDLPPLIIETQFIEDIKKQMPELPAARRARFIRDYGLSPYDAGVLTMSRAVADYFEKAVSSGATPKNAANWIGTDILGKLNAENKEISQSPLPARELAGLIKYIEKGTISVKIARDIFGKVWRGAGSVEALVVSSGSQISDAAQLEIWAKEAIAENPKAAADIKAGNPKAVGALVGGVMRKSCGKANPAVLNRIINELLK
jgi:aspartyl-tRNA(Asn)/glutamyl-tRNA(Gln) amidotransferase subunit B